nr:hypothetical protein [Tanacetum cinerariifolium]
MKTRRKDTELPQTSMPTKVVANKAVYEEMYDSVERATTTAIGLDAKRQETMKDAATQTRSERVSKYPNGPPLLKVNILRSGEDKLQLQKLMELYTKLSERVLNLETTKTAQAKEISSLKMRVKRLEKKKKSGTHNLKRLYNIGLSARVESSAEEKSLDEEDASKQRRNIADIDADAETTLFNETTEDQGRYNDPKMFDTGVLDDEEVVVEKAVADKEVDAAQDQVSAATTTAAKDLTIDDITLAKALEALKTSKPKIRGIVVRDHEEPSKSKTTTTHTSIADSTRPKLQAEQEEEERIAREKALAANIVEWDDVQAMIDADYELAARLQEE